MQNQPVQSCAFLVSARRTKAEHQPGRGEHPDALQVIAGAVEHVAGQAGQGAGDQGCLEARVGPLGVDCSQPETVLSPTGCDISSLKVFSLSLKTEPEVTGHARHRDKQSAHSDGGESSELGMSRTGPAGLTRQGSLMISSCLQTGLILVSRRSEPARFAPAQHDTTRTLSQNTAR